MSFRSRTMTAPYRSSVFFQSNVLPIGDSFHDSAFLSKITDPVALEKLRADPDFKLTRLTPLQQEILDKCGIHCVYAEKDDYPWGIPAGSHDGAKSVCLCTQTECAKFSECRPDFISRNNKNTGKIGINAPPGQIPHKEPDTAPSGFSDKEEGQCPQQDSQPCRVDGNFDFAQDASPLAPPIGNVPSFSTMSSDIVPQIKEENLQDNIGGAITYSDNLPDNVPCDEECPQEEIKEAPPEKVALSGACTDDRATSERVNGDAPPSSASATPCPEDGFSGCPSFEAFTPADQAAVVGLPASARVLVNAAPGTGKTWTLIQRIRHLVENEAVKPEQILVLTFTRAASAVIRERIGTEARNGTEIADIDTGTFDSFAFTLLNQCRETYPLQCPNTAGMQHEDGIIAARNLISELRDEPLLGGYLHVIIDEIQDLSGPRALLVMELLASLPSGCGFTLLGDSCQSIYDWRKDGDGSQIFSADLYKWLMSPESKITRYISFSRDYRRCGEGLPGTADYRRAILGGEKSGIDRQLTALLGQLEHSDKELKDTLLNIPENETLAILTRSNGMALVVSSRLSLLGVAHTRLGRTAEHTLANWIADVFMDWGHDTIHRDEFSAKFMELYEKTENEDMAHACWNALAKGSPSGRQEIRDLLAAIPGSCDPLLWRNAGTVRPLIEVGNVFKAKGREYDNVILIDELFRPGGIFGDDDGAMAADEDRVRYVALTRARKRMSRLPNPPDSNYLYKDKYCGERIFKSGRIRGKGFRPKYIASFEVGIEGDIDQESFAAMPSTQEYIVLFAKNCSKITLDKMHSKKTENIPIYAICALHDDKKYIIGYTGKSFKESLERSLRRIYENPNKDIPYRYYPDSMSEIYVTGRSSHVSVWKPSLTGAARFGDMALWRGISCQGLAVTYRENY